MSNTASIKGFMNFPTQFADGTVIGNEDGGPAFLNAETVAETTPTTGALAGVKVITKHTTAQPTRDIEVGEGEYTLVPAATAWGLAELRDRALVPGPIDHREGPAIIYKGLARLTGVPMNLGGEIADIAIDPANIKRVVNLTPHAVTFKRDGMDDVTVEPSGQVARVAEKFTDAPIETIDDVPVYALEYTGEVIGLPEQEDGTIYVASMLTIQGMLALGIRRGDVVSPNFVPAIGGAPSVTLHI